MSNRLSIVGALTAVIAFALAGVAMAGSWSGKEVTKDGVTHVMNPATPVEPAAVHNTDVLWSAGGFDDEEIIFGVLIDIATDGAGNVYVLDQQLNEIQVFTPDGEHLRTIGREGEGPGEFRRPSAMFMTPDGNVAVIQSMPGKVVLLTPDGEPVGNHPVPEVPGGGMQAFFDGGRAGGNIVLSTNEFARREGGMDITRKLVCVSPTGELLATYNTHRNSRDFAAMSFDEKEMRALEWVAGPDGRIYASENFDAYQIKVYNPDASVERVIEREYEHRVRTGDEMEENKPRIMIRRRGGRAQQPETKASKTDRDIMRMYAREDGSLWVVSSRGALDTKNGHIATFDVFDADGRFTRQVTLAGDGRFGDDGLHFMKDRLYVVKGLRAAQRSQHGEETEGDMEEEEPEPISLVCYDLREIVQGSR